MSSTQRTSSLFAGLSGRHRRPEASTPAERTPLVVALHGGSYTSAYFDVPGASLFELAGTLGIPMLAPDRPGYGDSPLLDAAEQTIEGQAGLLHRALKDAWQRHGEGTRGIVLIGHSIGGAIALNTAARMAGETGGVPLLGVAVSGVCLRTPPEHKPMWESLPDVPKVDLPPPVKDEVMFGPPGSFDAALVRASDVANAPAPKAELVDIVSTWEARAPGLLARIDVPVHYRQAEIDKLWIMSQGEVDGFERALVNSPRVDAAMLRGTGHCIDFHHVGRALQLQQLAFALQCASEQPVR